MTQHHEFQVDRAVLKSLISAQSGTPSKALLEAVMNAIDADASAVHMTLSHEGFEVVDDGRGFKDQAEFHAFFGVFGWDHSEAGRTFGTFGIGRGQVMALARTSWASADFRAHVDIEAHGYGYALETVDKAVKGLRITGTWYRPLDGVAVYHATQELQRLCKYALIDVTLNGRLISADPTKARWDHEDDIAYYRFSDSRGLEVYSQGIAVETISAWRYGIGGLIVTKRGSGLAMNMARNQLLSNECPVWQRIEKVVKRAAKEAQREGAATNKVTDASRAAVVAELMATPDGRRDLWDGPHITLIDGRHTSLSSASRRKAWVLSPERSRAADRLHMAGATCCLSQRTLDRFQVSTVAELLSTLQGHFAGDRFRKDYLEDITVYEELEDCPGFEVQGYEIVPVKQLDKRQKAALSIARWMNDGLARALGKQARTIVPGQSESAEGWTDGQTYIAVEARQLSAAVRGGLLGWQGLVALLVHEYCHEAASTTTHGHSIDFFEAFHEAMFDRNVIEWGKLAYLRHCRKAKDVTKPALSLLTKLCEVDVAVADGSLEQPQEIPVAAGDLAAQLAELRRGLEELAPWVQSQAGPGQMWQKVCVERLLALPAINDAAGGNTQSRRAPNP